MAPLYEQFGLDILSQHPQMYVCACGGGGRCKPFSSTWGVNAGYDHIKL